MNPSESVREEINSIPVKSLTVRELLEHPLSDLTLATLLDSPVRRCHGPTIVAIAEHGGAGVLTARQLIRIVAADTNVLCDAELARIVQFGSKHNTDKGVLSCLLIHIRRHVNYGEITEAMLGEMVTCQDSHPQEGAPLLQMYRYILGSRPDTPYPNTETYPFPSLRAEPGAHEAKVSMARRFQLY